MPNSLYPPDTVFQVGDIGTLAMFSSRYTERIAAVVVTSGPDYLTKVVFLDGSRLPGKTTGYHANRGWWSPELYDWQPLENPTPEQIATAAHIVLTGYVPGVDDELEESN